MNPNPQRTRWERHAAMIPAVLTIVAAVCIAGARAQRGGAAGTPPPTAAALLIGQAAQDLQGTIDVHVHSHPDIADRALDGLEAAVLARSNGQRGLVLKNHYDPTAGMAYMIRKQVPGLEVFGGIDLNLTVGGMNAFAVDHLAQLPGEWARMVWMSTFDAENAVRSANQQSTRPFVPVAKNGELLPATKAVIAVIARYNPKLILATGHVSPEEGLLMIREAKRLGVTRMVVTHAAQNPVNMTVVQMKEAAGEGAFIEFCGGSPVGSGVSARMDAFARQIREVGPQSVIMSTDAGQAGQPLPPVSLAAFIANMRARGITDGELDLMTRQNPAKLLGLPLYAAPPANSAAPGSTLQHTWPGYPVSPEGPDKK